MEKIAYITPEMEVIKLQLQNNVLGVISGSGENAGGDPVPGDPGDEPL